MGNQTEDIQVQIIYSNRKTLSVQVKMEGVIVRAPQRMSRREINDFLKEKRVWIEKHLAEMKKRKAYMEQMSPLTMEEIRVLADKALVVIPEKVKKYAPLAGVTYGKITIRSQHSRWGSCSEKGNLNFNCLLMLMPDEVIDYVVVHELCHRIEMNHSPRFYAEVERVMPEYGRWKQWLKENGGLYISRLP